MPIANISMLPNYSAAFTRLDYVESLVPGSNSNKVVYARYCVVVLSRHEQSNGLGREIS